MDLAAAALALGGEVSGHGIVAPGPGHSPRDRSLSVLFSPHAPDGFVVRSHAGDDDMVAKDYVRSRLGLIGRETRLQLLEREARPASIDGNRRTRAVALFNEGRDPLGTPADIYLQSRGVALPDEPLRVLRFHEAAPFAGRKTLALLSLVIGIHDNVPQAIHRTALDCEGQKAAIGGKVRLALGPLAGGAVKLSADEDVTTCLGIGEGIETTLSLRLLPEFGASPVWSVISASGIAAFPVLSGIEVLWIAVDHDPAGERAARACAERWREAGREVFLVRPKAAKADLNDVIQGGRRHG